MYQKASNGAGVEDVLLADVFEKAPLSVSADGRFLLYTIVNQGTRRNDLWVGSTTIWQP